MPTNQGSASRYRHDELSVPAGLSNTQRCPVSPLELRTSLEEHQSALELIMTKYREQVFRLLMASKKDDPAIVTQLKEQHTTVRLIHTHTHRTSVNIYIYSMPFCGRDVEKRHWFASLQMNSRSFSLCLPHSAGNASAHR